MSSSKIANRIERVQRSLNRVINSRTDSNTALALSKLNKLLVVARKLDKDVNTDLEYLQKKRITIRQDIFRLNENSYKKIAQLTLEEKINDAIKQSEEYSYSPFADRLKMIAKDPRIATIMLQGSKVKVTYEMDKIAGNYRDYLEAVRATRAGKGKTRGLTPENAQNIYGGESYPDLASRIWAEKIWGTFKGNKVFRRVWKGNKYEKSDATADFKGLYEQIIYERLSNVKHIAPFWSLLDKGNVNMRAFGKGLATPSQKPTNFVLKARLESNQLIEETFQTDVEQATNEIDDQLASSIRLSEWLFEIIQQIEQIITGISSGVSQVEKYEREFYSKGIKQLEKAAKIKGITGTFEVEKKAIAERAREKALQMVSGVSLARAELGTFFGVRIRPRTRKISRKIAQEEPYVIYPLDPKVRERLLALADQVANEYKQTMAILRSRR